MRSLLIKLLIHIFCTCLIQIIKMSTSIAEICENTKLAREAALLGNYETAGVYYQGVVQQIHRLLATITDPIHKGRWQSVNICLYFL